MVLSPRVIAIVSFAARFPASPGTGRVRRFVERNKDHGRSAGHVMIKNGSEQTSTSEMHLLRPADVSTASRGPKDGMKTPIATLCVYNQTRECFLGLRVTAADTSFARLKGLIGRLHLRSDEGIWVVPSSGVHTLGVLFRLDLIYLNESQEVIDAIEYFPRFRIAPLRIRAASVLELPQHTIYSSQTQKGDRLLICAPEEMETRLRVFTNSYVSEDQEGTESTARSG
jgi:uncharacterized membrane protein (UPF0127 family)